MNSELTGRNQGVPDAFSFTQPTFFIYSVPADDNSSYHSEMSTYTYPEITHEPCDNGTDSFHFSYFHNGWYNTTIDLTIGEVADRYTIRLYAKDHAGNSITYDHTVKGLFAGVLDFINDIWKSITATLSKAWDAIKSAVDWIVEWVVNLLKEVYEKIIDGIKSMISGYADSIGRIIADMMGTENPTNKGREGIRTEDVMVISMMGVMRIVRIESSIETEFVIFDTAAVSAEAAATAESGGTLLLVKKIMMAVAEKLVEKRLVIMAVSHTVALGEFAAGFSSVIDAVLTGSINKAIELIKSLLGIGDKLADALGNLAFILMNLGAKKGTGRYYFGFSLAMLGFLTSMVSKAMGLTGKDKIGVDMAMAGLAFGGLASFLISEKSKYNAWRKVIASLTTNIEFLIAVAGFSSAMFDLAWDSTQGGE